MSQLSNQSQVSVVRSTHNFNIKYNFLLAVALIHKITIFSCILSFYFLIYFHVLLNFTQNFPIFFALSLFYLALQTIICKCLKGEQLKFSIVVILKMACKLSHIEYFIKNWNKQRQAIQIYFKPTVISYIPIDKVKLNEKDFLMFDLFLSYILYFLANICSEKQLVYKNLSQNESFILKFVIYSMLAIILSQLITNICNEKLKFENLRKTIKVKQSKKQDDALTKQTFNQIR